MDNLEHFISYCKQRMEGTTIPPFLHVGFVGYFKRPDEVIVEISMTVRGRFSQSFHCTLGQCIHHFLDIDTQFASQLNEKMTMLPDQESSDDVYRISSDLRNQIGRKFMSIFNVPFDTDCDFIS